ncbi:hypothetical protein D2V04_06130 [Pelagerythrobacter aerophilus]|uniref:Uncharacterized protein n=1 Tax=Pelagerythrobacter aerophilus TaxID=2306995 RepID=A0A418NJN1_9SPHN|nr:hypothetical protein D2V04_06130 [Pelagerythrobacter aerophilus]
MKGWDLNEDGPAFKALQRYHEEPTALGAMQQQDTDSQKQAICDIIDALDADTVYLDWDGKDVSKEEAKRYVLEYRA